MNMAKKGELAIKRQETRDQDTNSFRNAITMNLANCINPWKNNPPLQAKKQRYVARLT